MLHNRFQAPDITGFEEEDFLKKILYISMVQTQDSGVGPFLDLGPPFE